MKGKIELMKRENQIILCIIFFIIGLLGFILQLFILESPDGILGFIMCLFNIYLMIGSIIRLCKLSKKIKNFLLELIDLLFFIN